MDQLFWLTRLINGKKILMRTTMTFMMAGVMLLSVGMVASVSGDELRGKVTSVLDGDTIQVLVQQKPVTVRLEGIDAPESEQRYGKQAKQALAQRVAGKTVTVQTTGTDKFDRTLGVVRVDGVNVNSKQIEEGWAWHFKRFSDDEQLARSEQAARRAKRGLWADEQPLAPWNYRDEQVRLKSAAAADRRTTSTEKKPRGFWLNEISGVRHNESCEHYRKTARGRSCGPTEGKACGICGG